MASHTDAGLSSSSSTSHPAPGNAPAKAAEYGPNALGPLHLHGRAVISCLLTQPSTSLSRVPILNMNQWKQDLAISLYLSLPLILSLTGLVLTPLLKKILKQVQLGTSPSFITDLHSSWVHFQVQFPTMIGVNVNDCL